MKLVTGLAAAALILGAAAPVPVLAQSGKSTMETGSNATDTGKMSSGQASGGKMMKKKSHKKNM